MQSNSRDLNSKRLEFLNHLAHLNEGTPDITGFQETFLGPQNSFILKSYNIRRQDGEDYRFGGLITLIKKEFIMKNSTIEIRNTWRKNLRIQRIRCF